MAIQLQLRKGTKAENDSFIGAEAELTYDTDTKGIRVHDGVTVGGNIIDTVVFFQAPTAENDYTWVRKYASGWVEQGGIVFPTTSTATRVSVTLPVTMSSSVYSVQVSAGDNTADAGIYSYYTNRTTTGFEILHNHTTTSYTIGDSWQVSGMAA